MPQENDNYFPLGIIAGSGMLPYELYEISSDLEKKCCIAHLNRKINRDRDDSDSSIHRAFNLGDIGSIIEFFKSNNVKYIVFAGGIERPDLSKLKVDVAGAHLLIKILKQKFLGDDKLLTIVAKFLEDKGFKVISAQDILMLENNSAKLKTTKKT